MAMGCTVWKCDLSCETKLDGSGGDVAGEAVKNSTGRRRVVP